MTREEALRKVKGYLTNIIPMENYSEVEEIIKALEQEPTYTSQIAQKAYEDGKKDGHIQAKLEQDDMVKCIKGMPSVTPIRPKGHWINKSRRNDCGILFVASECTCCGKKTLFNCDEFLYRYCPNCGADMREVEE